MRPLRFIARHQALLGHHLHCLENCRISDLAFALKSRIYLANCLRPFAPENVEDLQLGVGGDWITNGHSTWLLQGSLTQYTRGLVLRKYDEVRSYRHKFAQNGLVAFAAPGYQLRAAG